MTVIRCSLCGKQILSVEVEDLPNVDRTILWEYCDACAEGMIEEDNDDE